MISVSTIIPCYRCSDTIRSAVDSIAKQTLRPAEIILVDDGSGDNTLKVLLQLQQDYGKDWIKVIALEKNCGVSIARNQAWDIASQDYIAFLDADDIWHPEKIAVQYSWMLNHPNITLSGHYALDNQIETLSKDSELIPENIKANYVCKNKILITNPFCTSSIMIKRNIKQRFNPSLRYGEDYLLWLEIVLSGNKSVVLNFPITYRFKAPFGESGLSKNIAYAQQAQKYIYKYLWENRYISFMEMHIFYLWSLAKYYRRWFIYLFRKTI